MNELPPPSLPRRVRWEWAEFIGIALALIAIWLWIGAGGGGRVLIGWLASAVLFGFGAWIAGRSEAARRYGHLLLAGGVAGFFGCVFAGHGQDLPSVFHAWWLAWPLLAIGAAALVFAAGLHSSRWLGLAGLGLVLLGVTLYQFTAFSLAANLLLLAVAVHFFRRQRWTAAAWLGLIGFYLSFLLGWPFSNGRVDADRYLALTEFWWALAFFAFAWVVFLRIAVLSATDAFAPPRRLLFATLNNALFYFLGVLILPPRHPDWYWKFTLAVGFLFLGAWALTDRYPPLRRAFAIHGALLLTLGVASAFIGPQPATMLAVASTFFVFSVEQRGQWLLRYCAGLGALLAVAFAVEPIYGSAALRDSLRTIFDATGPRWDWLFGNYEPSLWLGIFVGAPLVFASIWISRHRELWRRWAVLFFGALGLGTWLLTTLAQTPTQHHPPILAVEAVIVTASFLVLAIREFPWLATTVLLLAQFLWFQQVGEYNARPWWNPLMVVVCTLGLSWWWQTRGRGLASERALKVGQGIAAAISVAIFILSLETAFGRSGTVLVALSLLAIGLLAYASFVRDWLLFGFIQLIVATAIGEFIGQLSHPPLPVWIAPLCPIAALIIIAPALTSPFTGTIWQKPAQWVALLYQALAAAMFVVWVFHYLAPANRFFTLALVALLLLSRAVDSQRGALFLASLICAVGALLLFYLGWLGAHGFLWRDLFGFVLLLGFGQILRRKQLLADELQAIGIILGLAAVTQWVSLCVHFSHPSLPITVVWAIVAAVIVCVGWWLSERLYRVFGWTLLVIALGRVLSVNLIASDLPLGTDPAFRLGLLAVGLAALVAALGYARRQVRAGK